MEKKFLSLENNYINGNLYSFRNELNKLSKHNLLRFLIWCSINEVEIDIFIVEKFLNN